MHIFLLLSCNIGWELTHLDVALFHLPARYGYENIFHQIYQRSGYEWMVHVATTEFSEYLCNSSLEDCTDPEPRIAHLIHACSTSLARQPGLPCQPNGVSVCLFAKCNVLQPEQDGRSEGSFWSGELSRS